MTESVDHSVQAFDADASRHGGYLYTDARSLSIKMATERSLQAILQTRLLTGRRVLDMGCGDGYFTTRLWDTCAPTSMVGVDAAERAIDVANVRKGNRPIQFEVHDAHRLPYPDNSFDVVLLQSVLHHDNAPQNLLREALRLAPEVLIHEPNGSNKGLKLLEKVSRYHREHGERSYTIGMMQSWVEQLGGRIEYKQYAGFVPMFCPDVIARAMKAAEPLVERIPVVKTQACAVYVVVARRTA